MDEPGNGPEDESTIDAPGSTGPAEGSTPEETGRYRVGQALGEGGMATVVEATDTRLGRQVALKVLRPSVARDRTMRERFERESRILASLSHPGMVAVHDAGSLTGDKLFIAMEKVRGKTLAEIIRSRSDAEIRDRHVLMKLIDIFERICQAIAYVHSHDIIHRDLKPTNIMVDDEFGVVFVMDWGLAKELPKSTEPGDNELTQAGVIMGTPGYMSPEQARGLAEASDQQTDVFALGVILYEILTGVKPFQGAGLKDLLKEIVYHDPEPPRALNRVAGRELSAVCTKALAKGPRDRYPSAREFADDIRRFREFLPVSAIRPRLVDRLGHWSRRNPVIASTLVTLLITALAFTAWSVDNIVDRRRTLSWAFSLVDDVRRDLGVLGREIESVQGQLRDSNDPVEKRFLERVRLPELRARRDVLEFEMRGRLLATLGFIYPDRDERVVSQLRQHVLEKIDDRMSAGQFARAEAHIESALAAHEGRNAYGLTDEDVVRLRSLLEQAKRELRERAENAR